MAAETSLRQLIVNIVHQCTSPTSIEEGVIMKREPLTITLVNDKKMKLSETDLILPERLKKNGELETGDKVNLLVCNNGKIYYVLDKS